jgi:hypothetical protein
MTMLQPPLHPGLLGYMLLQLRNRKCTVHSEEMHHCAEEVL